MKRGLAILSGIAALTLLSGGVVAQSACRVLDPELAGSYQGGCRDGLADGYGEARGAADYRGDFRAGRKHGKGVKSWPWGDRYEGDFVEDRKEGIGTYTWSARGPSAGERYSGGYLADRRHGFGTYAWPSGDVYAGPWANDEVVGVPTAGMLARARMEKEAEVVVSRPGTKVCRQLTVGISERDWVRGVVVGADADGVAVRIDDPGRFQHTLYGVELVRGTVVRDALRVWMPCL